MILSLSGCASVNRPFSNSVEVSGVSNQIRLWASLVFSALARAPQNDRAREEEEEEGDGDALFARTLRLIRATAIWNRVS